MKLSIALKCLVLVTGLGLAVGPALAEVTVPAGEPYNDYINNGTYFGSHAGAIAGGAIGTLCCSPVVGGALGVAGSDLGGWAGGEIGVQLYDWQTYGDPMVFTYDPPSDTQTYGDWMPMNW